MSNSVSAVIKIFEFLSPKTLHYIIRPNDEKLRYENVINFKVNIIGRNRNEFFTWVSQFLPELSDSELFANFPKIYYYNHQIWSARERDNIIYIYIERYSR